MNTLKMMSVGDHIARILGNDELRQKMRYRSSREAVEGRYSDYFDSAEYKEFKEKNNFENPDDVAVALFVDGFVNQKKSKIDLTIVHVVILNYDPALR